MYRNPLVEVVKLWLLTALLGGAVWWGYRIYDWRKVMNARTGEVEKYLEEPVLRTPDGREFNRKQLLDALIAGAVEQGKK